MCLNASQRKILDQVVEMGLAQYWMIRKFKVPVVFWIYSSATKRGSEPTRV